MKTLQEIGLRHGTDKSRNQHKGITYLQLYEKYLVNKREYKLKLLEIGVLEGSSVRAFEEFLPNSKIIGLDIDPRCKVNERGRVEIVIGSQDSKQIRDDIKKRHGEFDLILDDASHVNQLTLKSFELYWPLVKDNGIYIIEDLPGCWTDMTKYNIMQTHPGMKYNLPGIELNNEKCSINDFILKHVLDLQLSEPTDIYNIEFYRGSMIFTKKI